MDLLSIFKRKTPSAASAAPVDGVQLARTRARRRLTGAAVLVVIGIVGFPLLFETQPRPIRVDVPIDIPRKDNVPPLVMPALQTPAPKEETRAEIITETKADAGREIAPPARTAIDASDELKLKSVVGTSAPKAAPGGSRFVVQIGAFSDATAAREARRKLEALGLNTYVQVANTSSGKLIRVRAGPFSKREEADKVAAKIREAAMPAVVLTL